MSDPAPSRQGDPEHIGPMNISLTAEACVLAGMVRSDEPLRDREFRVTVGEVHEGGGVRGVELRLGRGVLIAGDDARIAAAVRGSVHPLEIAGRVVNGGAVRIEVTGAIDGGS